MAVSCVVLKQVYGDDTKLKGAASRSQNCIRKTKKYFLWNCGTPHYIIILARVVRVKNENGRKFTRKK